MGIMQHALGAVPEGPISFSHARCTVASHHNHHRGSRFQYWLFSYCFWAMWRAVSLLVRSSVRKWSDHDVMFGEEL